MSEQIIVLSDKEQARTRINVFHGSANHYVNLVKELIGNSHDVFDKQELNEIQIILHNSNKIEYIDSGKGIPVEGIASNGSPNYEAIFERAFAGSKYNNEFASVGQNGIFLYTLSMTCEDIEYYIARPNGKLYYIKYHKGDRVSDLKTIGKEDKTYTRIIFTPDNEVWNNPHYTYEELCTIAKAQASLGNVRIIVEDKQTNKKSEFYYPNGIEDYFNEMTSKKSKVIDNININKTVEYKFDKIINGETHNLKDDIEVQLLFNYSNDSEDDFQKEFLNTADLLLHGTIQDGIYNGLKNIIHKWLKNNNKYDKNEKPITLEDVSTGLNYICNVGSKYVEYDNQIKQKTSVLHYKSVLQSIIEDYMEIFFIENTFEGQKLYNQVLLNMRARTKAEKTRLDIKSKLQNNQKNGLSPKVDGLKHCDMKHSTLEERILILDEGISANSTIIDSFDNRIMGAYGLRGRFINSLKAKVTDVLNNVPARGIIDALGCGIEIPKEERKLFRDIKTFNLEDLKYGSVGILCDSDAFGKGIGLSLISFFYKFMPTLLKQGRIYLVVSPRFQIETKKKESYYVYNEDEKNEMIKTLGEKNIDSITIRKGLGEFNKDEFWELVLSEEARKKTFIKIKYQENEEEMIKFYFNALMGEDIVNRKQFIRDNIVNVNIDNLD